MEAHKQKEARVREGIHERLQEEQREKERKKQEEEEAKALEEQKRLEKMQEQENEGEEGAVEGEATGAGEEGAGEEEGKEDDLPVERPDSQEKLGPKPPGIENIDDEVKQTLFNQWQKVSQNYKRQMCLVFAANREQRERMIEKLSHLSKKFLKFLHRADNKQEKLDDFIEEFNTFTDEFPDLREDDQTKEELH